MQRRDFLKSSAAFAAALTHSAEGTGLAAAKVAKAVAQRSFPFNTGWRFKAEAALGAEHPDFDDASFTEVVLPHSNAALPWHDFGEQAYTFLSTYRRRFHLSESARDKRIFLDFEGAMTASTVWINGHRLGEYRGGYTPFSFELTDHARPGQDNVVTVFLDSTERADIPPFGGEIDYLTFGGIYREASLRIVPHTYLDNIAVRSIAALSGMPQVEVNAFLAGVTAVSNLSIRVDLLDGERLIATETQAVHIANQPNKTAATLPNTVAPVALSSQAVDDANRVAVLVRPNEALRLWDLDSPNLYTARVTLLRAAEAIDQDTRRFGVREAKFTDAGFSLNGRVVKLRGMNRHQTFPYVGAAMPGRVQQRDADILRKEYHCNIVRTSHYPQSRHFLDRCDEIGLLVLEELPGWQHIGPLEWQDLSVDNVARMIRRDWNHPAIILWGVRINESRDDHEFYTRTNRAAHALDPTRQTGGIRNRVESELLEDVFTINDFGFPLKEPNHPLYLNTEFVGHTFPTRVTDGNEHQREHTLRHARIHNQLGSSVRYAGGICWCAFDYNTHADFGAGDHMCYHGVFDMFREPKLAAGFYKSQIEPSVEVVLEPAFHWSRGDEPLVLQELLFCSNCDTLRIFTRSAGKTDAPWEAGGAFQADHATFAYLRFPPFRIRVSDPGTAHMNLPWGDLKVEGWIGAKLAITRMFSGMGVSQKFSVTADDEALLADGADATRVVMRVTDMFGAMRPLASDPVVLHLDGPGTLIGPSSVELVGGVGAVWLRSGRNAGTLTLAATHPRLGERIVRVRTQATSPPSI